MPSILVVCTGNVCRSPVAEGLLRAGFDRRFGRRAPSVASAGVAGWEGSNPTLESLASARELGIDISEHRARRLVEEHLEGTDLVLAMGAEHRAEVLLLSPSAHDRTFTLKELVRLVEAIPRPSAEADPGLALRTRVAEAAALRRSGFQGDWTDEDIPDPLGRPQRVYRRVARELDEWCGRLTDGLFGRASARSFAEGR